MSNYTFGLKNFRIFDEKGAEFEIAPITILTGSNSSGKSTVIKAIMLLKNFTEQIIKDFSKGNVSELKSYNLNLINELHNLGLFENIKNKFSESEEVTLLFSKFSWFVNGDITVEYTFINDKDSLLKSGNLKSVCCSFDNEVLFKYYTDKGVGFTQCNMALLKSHFFNFTNQAKEYNRKETLIKDFENSNGNWCDIENSKIDSYFNDQTNFLNQNNIDDNNSKNFHNFLKSDLCSITDREYTRIFNREYKQNSFFHLPFIDLIGNVDKNDIDKTLKKLIDNNNVKDEYLLDRLNRVITDFKNSKFELFFDYYFFYENLFIENIEYKDENGFSIFGRLFKSIYNELELLTLRSRILSENPEWIPYGSSKVDVKWEKIGGDDFDYEDRKFRVIFHTIQDFSFMIDDNYKTENYISKLDGFDDKEVKDFEVFLMYFGLFLHESLINLPSFISNVHFIGAERVNLQRLYTKDSNTEFTKTLFQLIRSIDDYNKLSTNRNDYKPYYFTKKWLGKDKFEIADDIEITAVEEGLGAFVKLKKDGKWGLLADEGFGVSKILAILLKIELLIIDEQIRNSLVKQRLERDRIEQKELCTIIIEEPESNLHPVLQSKLADLFDELAYKNKHEGIREYKIMYGFNFIIETHSEYFIRKTQLLVKEKGYEIAPNENPFAIHYIDRKSNSHWKMEYREDGKFVNEFGSGFFDETRNTVKKML